jgi:hypothetical protein
MKQVMRFGEKNEKFQKDFRPFSALKGFSPLEFILNQFKK